MRIFEGTNLLDASVVCVCASFPILEIMLEVHQLPPLVVGMLQYVLSTTHKYLTGYASISLSFIPRILQ